jgi:hypothetical protein
MYIDQIKAYINSTAGQTITIPDHPLIHQLQASLTRKDFERACLLLYYTYRLYRHSIRSTRRICIKTFHPYQIPIFYSIQDELLGRRRIKHVMSALKCLGIITLTKKGYFRKATNFRLPAVYSVSKQVWHSPARQIILNDKCTCKTWKRFLELRSSPFTPVDRKIIIQNHQHLRFEVTGYDYALRMRWKALRKAQVKAESEGRVFVRAEWRRAYIRQCRDIDVWNQTPNIHKWLVCRVDQFGNRLHHQLTSAQSFLRQYARIGNLVPLFEVDVKSSQPTFAAILMCQAGVRDEEYIKDINDGLFYERFGERYGDNWTRNQAKGKVFAALYGVHYNEGMKDLAKSYPVFAKYLKDIKSEFRHDEFKRLDGYEIKKNNCIDAQRAESKWARDVWKELLTRGIRFLPIHDSVLVFGDRDTSSEKIEAMKVEVKEVMQNKLARPSFGINPILEIKDY